MDCGRREALGSAARSARHIAATTGFGCRRSYSHIQASAPRARRQGCTTYQPASNPHRLPASGPMA